MEIKISTLYDVPGIQSLYRNFNHKIECDHHLIGHSDADVLLHAITDAILGIRNYYLDRIYIHFALFQ